MFHSELSPKHATYFQSSAKNRVVEFRPDKNGGSICSEPISRSWLKAHFKHVNASTRAFPVICLHNVRRAFDLACAVTGLVVLIPLFVLIALAIKLDDGGPILFSHFRIGRGFRKFRLQKFRTMISISDGTSYVTSPSDARITRVGRYLRKYKLDELPQLINVVKGEMQLVGPRPQMEGFVDIFREAYAELLEVPPGITDLATLSFRNEELFFTRGSIEEQYVKRIMPVKLRLALNYSRTRTFCSDLEMIFRTVLGMGAPVSAWKVAGIDSTSGSPAEYFARNAD